MLRFHNTRFSHNLASSLSSRIYCISYYKTPKDTSQMRTEKGAKFKSATHILTVGLPDLNATVDMQ